MESVGGDGVCQSCVLAERNIPPGNVCHWSVSLHCKMQTVKEVWMLLASSHCSDHPSHSPLIHSKKKSTYKHLFFFLVLQLVTNGGLYSVPGSAKWHLVGPWQAYWGTLFSTWKYQMASGRTMIGRLGSLGIGAPWGVVFEGHTFLGIFGSYLPPPHRLLQHLCIGWPTNQFVNLPWLIDWLIMWFWCMLVS